MSSTPRNPSLATDCVLFDAQDRVLLIRRGNAPFKGNYAIPGGFVDVGESVETACRRELKEETGLTVGKLRLVGVYSEPDRDPRSHVVSVVYMGEVKTAKPKAGDDASDARWVKYWRRAKLAFDHANILSDADALRNSIRDR